MQVTIDSTDSAEHVLAVLGAMYDVSLTTATTADQPPPAAATRDASPPALPAARPARQQPAFPVTPMTPAAAQTPDRPAAIGPPRGIAAVIGTYQAAIQKFFHSHQENI